MKVQDASDSKEILKNSDAASITVTGRGYLQVGNNEVYELFQSAWSGAPYRKKHSKEKTKWQLSRTLDCIHFLESKRTVGKKKGGITEIEAVTAKIAQTQTDMDIQKLASPWLPPLAIRIEKDEIIAEEQVDSFAIGMIDEPEKQSQTPIDYTCD